MINDQIQIDISNKVEICKVLNYSLNISHVSCGSGFVLLLMFMNKIIHPTHVLTFNHISNPGGLGGINAFGGNFLAQNASHVTREGGREVCGQFLQELGKNWIKFRRETKLLCCMLAKQKRG